MEVYVDATTLIALGDAGHLAFLENLDGQCVVPETVAAEVTTQPATTRVEALIEGDADGEGGPASRQEASEIPQTHLDTARDILGESDSNGDIEIIASVLWVRDRGDVVAVVSDDRRVRTVAGDFGATVTGTVGVVVRAVHEGLTGEEAKSIVREIDSRGLHVNYPTLLLRRIRASVLEGRALMWTPGNQSPAIGW